MFLNFIYWKTALYSIICITLFVYDFNKDMSAPVTLYYMLQIVWPNSEISPHVNKESISEVTEKWTDLTAFVPFA